MFFTINISPLLVTKSVFMLTNSLSNYQWSPVPLSRLDKHNASLWFFSIFFNGIFYYLSFRSYFLLLSNFLVAKNPTFFEKNSKFPKHWCRMSISKNKTCWYGIHSLWYFASRKSARGNSRSLFKVDFFLYHHICTVGWTKHEYIDVASYMELISVTKWRTRGFIIQYFLQGMWDYILIMRPSPFT